MKFFITIVAALFLLFFWLSGFVVAKGFWSTLCCIFPFYAWYLVIEKFFIYFGIV